MIAILMIIIVFLKALSSSIKEFVSMGAVGA